MRTENIKSVMCNGTWIMKDRQILTVDEHAVLHQAQAAAANIIVGAQIQLPRRMNFL